MTNAKIERVYPVFEIPHIHDGDTLWVRRRWPVGEVDGVELIAQDYPGGICVRLTDGKKGLNTPEMSKTPVKAKRARADLETIVSNWVVGGKLELVTWGDETFGRTLGDLRVQGTTYSLVNYMIDRGWAVYK